MITGRQIREARILLGWKSETRCLLAGVTAETLTRAEDADGAPDVPFHAHARIQQALERAGVHFGQNGAVMRVRGKEDP